MPSDYDPGLPTKQPDPQSNTTTPSADEPTKVKFVRLAWVDFSGCVKYKIVSSSRYDEMIQSPLQSLLSITACALGLNQDAQIAAGLSPSGDIYLQPEPSSYRPLSYHPKHAMVMCNLLSNKDSEPHQLSHLIPHPLCPRSLLSSTLHSSQLDDPQENSISYLIGFEIEVVLLDSSRAPFVPVDYYDNPDNWSGHMSLRNGGRALECMEKIIETLEQSNIDIEQWHAESAPGQFKIILAPQAPSQACDTLVYAKELIHNIASTTYVKATFSPRPFHTACGTGAHIHLFLQKNVKEHSDSEANQSPAFSSKSHYKSPSPMESNWLAGLLSHLPAISAFTLPTDASYERLTDSTWCGGTWVCWGTANNKTPIRLCASFAPSGLSIKNHFEVKTADSTSNIYLALSAILTAGLLGIQSSSELTHGDCRADSSKLTNEERQKYKITTPMPRYLEQALLALEEDKELENALGNFFVRTYATVKRAESQLYHSLPIDGQKSYSVRHY